MLLITSPRSYKSVSFLHFLWVPFISCHASLPVLCASSVCCFNQMLSGSPHPSTAAHFKICFGLNFRCLSETWTLQNFNQLPYRCWRKAFPPPCFTVGDDTILTFCKHRALHTVCENFFLFVVFWPEHLSTHVCCVSYSTWLVANIKWGFLITSLGVTMNHFAVIYFFVLVCHSKS